jgi:hypothetical protein
MSYGLWVMGYESIRPIKLNQDSRRKGWRPEACGDIKGAALAGAQQVASLSVVRPNFLLRLRSRCRAFCSMERSRV